MALGLLAAISALASAMPAMPAVAVAVAAVGYGAWLGARELRAVPPGLSIARDGTALVDGEPVGGFRVRWRGPVAFLLWRDSAGRRRRLVATPDVLDAPSRRALRLAAPTAHSRASVAP